MSLINMDKDKFIEKLRSTDIYNTGLWLGAIISTAIIGVMGVYSISHTDWESVEKARKEKEAKPHIVSQEWKTEYHDSEVIGKDPKEFPTDFLSVLYNSLGTYRLKLKGPETTFWHEVKPEFHAKVAVGDSLEMQVKILCDQWAAGDSTWLERAPGYSAMKGQDIRNLRSMVQQQNYHNRGNK